MALFGESSKGTIAYPYFIDSLGGLYDTCGFAPEESDGIGLAIQSLMYDFDLIYFRVHEEGFSKKDYFLGLDFFKNQQIKHLEAIALPKVGDREIIGKTDEICKIYKSLLIFSEKDLFDYLTSNVKK